MLISRPRFLVLFAVLLPPNAQGQAGGATYINPPGLAKPTGYTHVVVAADRRTMYIAGQVAFDSTGRVVGGADRYLDPQHPPASTLIIASLVRPELLLEIEAVASLRVPFKPPSH